MVGAPRVSRRGAVLDHQLELLEAATRTRLIGNDTIRVAALRDEEYATVRYERSGHVAPVRHSIVQMKDGSNNG